MDAPGGDYVSAFSSDVDALSEHTDGIAYASAPARKVKVASFTRLDRYGLGQLFVFSLQGLQTRLADIAVNIENKDPGAGASGNADVGVGPLAPPSFDGLPPGGGVFDAFGRARMF